MDEEERHRVQVRNLASFGQFQSFQFQLEEAEADSLTSLEKTMGRKASSLDSYIDCRAALQKEMSAGMY